MRRGLAFISLFLVLLGLEMSTEALTLLVQRIGTGIGAVLAGTEFQVSPFRFISGLVALLLGLALWGALVWSGHKRTAIATVGGTCPRCGHDTKRVKRREWQRLLSLLLGENLTQRMCETCGWVGLSTKQ